MGSLSLLQGIFSTQGSNPGFPHCRQILYQLSQEGRNINNLRHADGTTLMAESEEEPKEPLDESERGE